MRSPRLLIADPSIRAIGGHYYEYALRIVGAAKELGVEPLLAVSRGLPEGTELPCRALAAYTHDFWGTRADGTREHDVVRRYIECKDATHRETAKALHELELAAGDHVFLPSLDMAALDGISELLAASALARSLRWHIIVRRNLYTGYPHDWQAQAGLVDGWRDLLARFVRRAHGATFHFYTDTPALTLQLSTVTLFDVDTLPVPVDARYAHAWLAQGGRRAHDGPLHLAYVGDARSEKGFDLLPGLVRSLAADFHLGGRFRLLAQSYTTSGEAAREMAEARAALQGELAGHVRLIDTALASDEYRNLVCDADLVLIPYARQNYIARSSGIFAEAMAGAVPVVVPAGTWMASELEGARALAHRAFAQRGVSMGRHPAQSLEWRTHHGGRDDRAESVLRSDGSLQLWGAPQRYAMVPLSDNDTHVLVTLELGERSDGEYVEVEIDLRDRAGMSLATERRIVGGNSHTPCSVLVPLPEGSPPTQARIAVRGAYTQEVILIDTLEVELLHVDEPLEREAPGETYIDEQDLARATARILTHYPRYAAGARFFAPTWYARHSATRLVAKLIG